MSSRGRKGSMSKRKSDYDYDSHSNQKEKKRFPGRPDETGVDELPRDVLALIFDRLPAIQITTSIRLVCKSFHTLLDSEDYVRSRLLSRSPGLCTAPHSIAVPLHYSILFFIIYHSHYFYYQVASSLSSGLGLVPLRAPSHLMVSPLRPHRLL